MWLGRNHIYFVTRFLKKFDASGLNGIDYRVQEFEVCAAEFCQSPLKNNFDTRSILLNR